MKALMKTIGIVAKWNHAAALRAASELHDWLKERGHDVLVLRSSLPEGHPLPAAEPHELRERADLLVVLGGDGTLIHTAALVHERLVPILGVNLGTFGFLAELEIGDLYSVMERVLAGDYRTEDRMRLTVQLFRGGQTIVS